MFFCVFLDFGEILDVAFFYEVPDDGVVHVEVSEDFAAGDQLGKGVVTDFYVGVVGSEGNGSKKLVLCERVFSEIYPHI